MKGTILLAVNVVVVLLLLTLVLLQWRKANVPLDAPAIVLQVQKMKQLVTVRYSLQRVESVTEQKVPFGSESLLIMVQGAVTAGIDLDSITDRDVVFSSASNHNLAISIPSAKITDVFLDEKQTKVWDRHVTWWTPWVPFSPDLETRARLKALEDIRSAALQMGILEQAHRNAETALHNFFDVLGIHVQISNSRNS